MLVAIAAAVFLLLMGRRHPIVRVAAKIMLSLIIVALLWILSYGFFLTGSSLGLLFLGGIVIVVLLWVVDLVRFLVRERSA